MVMVVGEGCPHPIPQDCYQPSSVIIGVPTLTPAGAQPHVWPA